jgi:hypothetical protein
MATTWTKLKDGSWGLRSTEALNTGNLVTVTRKDGTAATVPVGALVWTGNGVWLYVAGAKTEDGAKPATSAKPNRPSGWRPCGYPGCNPSFCDECDGEGYKSSGRRRYY